MSLDCMSFLCRSSNQCSHMKCPTTIDCNQFLLYCHMNLPTDNTNSSMLITHGASGYWYQSEVHSNVNHGESTAIAVASIYFLLFQHYDHRSVYCWNRKSSTDQWKLQNSTVGKVVLLSAPNINWLSNSLLITKTGQWVSVPPLTQTSTYQWDNKEDFEWTLSILLSFVDAGSSTQPLWDKNTTIHASTIIKQQHNLNHWTIEVTKKFASCASIALDIQSQSHFILW